MPAEFEFLTFDCYGTLIDWRQGIAAAFAGLAANAGRAIEPEKILQLHARIEPELQAEDFRSYRQILDLTAARIGVELGFEIPAERLHFLSDSLPQWPAFADTGPALRRLHAAGYRLGILSNIDDDLLAGTLRHLPVEFELLVTAQQVGSYKPALAHFRRARQRIGSARWLHVAQSFFHDVQPAVAMDLPVVWINRLAEKPYTRARPLAVFPDLASFAERATGDGGLRSS